MGVNLNTANRKPKPWLDSEGRFKLGKYGPQAGSRIGQYVEDVAVEDPGYFGWILDNVDDIDPDDRDIVEAWFHRAT